MSGVTYRSQYNTRHSYASTLLSNSEAPIKVANQLGHSDTHTALSTYARWIPETDR